MASLKSHPNKSVNGVDYIDQRSTLYYSKYQYRARVKLEGLNRLYYTRTFLEFNQKLHRMLKDSHSGHYQNRLKQEIATYDMNALEKFIEWRNQNSFGRSKQAMIRIEYNTAGVFSNDLQLLKTLESLSPGNNIVDYTEIDQSIPQGIKYYVKKPAHNYRVYLKSKRVEPADKESLKKFIDRYKGTGTVIVPSDSLKRWLNPSPKRANYWSWNEYYLSGHYYIDFDQESTDTLFSLMHGNLIGRRFKLEKRPDPV